MKKSIILTVVAIAICAAFFSANADADASGGVARIVSFLTSGGTFSNPNGQILAPNGSAISPSYSFTGNTHQGMFSVNSNRLGFSGGASVLELDIDSSLRKITAIDAVQIASTGTSPALDFAPSAATALGLQMRNDNLSKYMTVGSSGTESFGLYASGAGNAAVAATAINGLGAALLATSSGSTPGIKISGTTLDVETATNEDLLLNANGTGTLNLATGAGTTRFSVNSSVAVIRVPLTSGSTTATSGGGTCTTITSVSGTALDFAISVTCAAAQTVVVNLSNFGGNPKCVIAPANAAAAATTGMAYESAATSSTATFTFPAVTNGVYNAICVL